MQKNEMITNQKFKVIFSLIFILIVFPLNAAFVSALDSIDNLDIDFHSVSVIRKGHIFPASITIRNLNENITIDIKKITILDDDKKIVKTESINKNFKSLKKSLERGEELINYLRRPEFCESPELVKEQPEFQEYINLYHEVKNETFKQSFRLDIRDFDSNLEIGDIVTVFIEIEIKIGNEKFVINRENQIKIAPPLPAPPHNSPGWFKGDMHTHSEFGSTIAEWPDPLHDMVDAAIIKDLDWVIFTDHSVAFSEASEWNEGYDACVANSTSSFKCLYGQEMSIGTPEWACDSLYNGHYLAYPYTDDNLGWINGYCGLTTCYCRDEQPVMNEINNAGGMGFIAHPHNPDTAFTEFDWDDWSVTGFTGLQIINEDFTNDDGITINNPGGDDDSWQEFLQAETNPDNGFIVGIGGSDAHYTNNVGESAFIYCYLNSLSTTNIRNAIKNGHCIASTGPFVAFTLDGKIIGESADVPSGTNSLSITANSAGFGNLEWLYIYVDEQVEEIIPLSGTSYSGSVNIDLDTNDDYIRLAVFTDEEVGGYTYRAYTNPIWVDVTTCTCGSWSEGSCGAGSCSSSQKQWTRSCTPSACVAETTCIYDESCEEEEESEVSDCTESGYEFCWEATYGDCDVSIAVNMYENVNDIQWGAVNDAWDPYVIGSYTVGWKAVDAWQMYYGNGVDETCGYGGCDEDAEVNDIDTKVTANAPSIADFETILGYDDTASYWCTLWTPNVTSFYPHYTPGDNPIYVLKCYNDSDCSASKYCDKSSSWSNWDCVNDKSDGQSCTRDAQCNSGYCDDDGVGLADDGWCFTPYNTYFDGWETNFCEVSTGSGISNCDERQVGEDLNLCLGTSYREEECSSTCGYQDITSLFECSDAGCSCVASQCDGLTTGSNINTCTYGTTTYFADKCTSTAGGEDRGDNICRNSSFAADCTASSFCNSKSPGDENTSTDECCYGSCTSLDCDGDDDTDGSDGTLKESEVTAGSCTSGCSSNSTCCDQQSITCSVTYECDYFHSLITNEDETPNNICYKPNSGNWKFASNAEATETACGDGYNNDCDGYADLSDPDCDTPPTVTLESPSDNNVSTTGNITFNCSATDDINLQNISLYTNISGTWELNKTNIVTGTANSTTFTINNIPDNTNFIWNCLAYDNASYGDWGDANWSIMIDMAPLIIKVNVTDWKGNIVNETNKASTWWNVTFNVLINNFFFNYFNNGLTVENLTFSGDENITRYLKIPKDASVTYVAMNLSGQRFPSFTDDFNRPDNDAVGNEWDESEGTPPFGAFAKIKDNELYMWSSLGGEAKVYRNLSFTPLNWSVDYKVYIAGSSSERYTTTFKFYNGSGDYLGSAKYVVEHGDSGLDCKNLGGVTPTYLCTRTELAPTTITNSWNRNLSDDLDGIIDLGEVEKVEFSFELYTIIGSSKSWLDNLIIFGTDDSYPHEPWLEVGTSDGTKEWNYSGEFNITERTKDLSPAINSALNNEFCDCTGCSLNGDNCLIPFLFHSDTEGKLEYSDLSVYYSDIDSVWVVIWDTTKEAGDKFLEGVMDIADGTWRVDVKLDNSFPPVVNYTVYVNDTSNNIASYDGRFGIIYVANETQGRIAIETGINNSVLTSPTIYTDYYMRYLNESRDKVGLFDKVTEELNQTWAFNYVSQGEYYTNMASMPDPVTGPIVNIWENDSLTEEEITYQVEAFIDETKQ